MEGGGGDVVPQGERLGGLHNGPPTVNRGRLLLDVRYAKASSLPTFLARVRARSYKRSAEVGRTLIRLKCAPLRERITVQETRSVGATRSLVRAVPVLAPPRVRHPSSLFNFSSPPPRTRALPRGRAHVSPPREHLRRLSYEYNTIMQIRLTPGRGHWGDPGRWVDAPAMTLPHRRG